MRWRRFPYNDGWGENRWYAQVEEGLWGVSQDGTTVFPAGFSPAKEMAESGLDSVRIVDGVTTEISMADFVELIAQARGENP